MDSIREDVVTAMSIGMRAEIVYYGRGSLKGALHSKYLEAPFEFYSLVRMIEKMEEVFDSKRFPSTFLKSRTFSSARNRGKKGAAAANDAPKEAPAAALYENMRGTTNTFEITVRFRQNATWQGQILWVEEQLRQDFRCVLEMLKLIDEAITSGEEADKPVAWEE